MDSLVLVVALLYLAVSAVRGFVNYLNLAHAQGLPVPPEFVGVVDEAKFRSAQDYLAAQTRYGLVSRVVSTLAGVGFLLAGGFGRLDNLASFLGRGEIYSALLYFLFLAALDQLIEIPFSLYHTFVLEERFGFNRSTFGTWLGDLLKGWVLGLLLGGLLLSAICWFFRNGGELAWLWAWCAFTAFQLLLTFLAPVVLMPLFNKFEPLPAGELKSAIEAFARKVDFKLQGIFTMDGSKRSSKANAFFTGFGRFRRIVLFDTLVKQQTVPELVAVLAHEVGHFKRKHILKSIAVSLLTTFLLFFLFSRILASNSLAASFGFSHPSVEAAFTIAYWFYAPFSLWAALLAHALSRKFEFEADAYARETTRDPASLVSALKKLSVESLSNLNPHPWKVFLDYSHPPVTQRLRKLLEGSRP
jgi:STE24 endopeptidase